MHAKEVFEVLQKLKREGKPINVTFARIHTVKINCECGNKLNRHGIVSALSFYELETILGTSLENSPGLFIRMYRGRFIGIPVPTAPILRCTKCGRIPVRAYMTMVSTKNFNMNIKNKTIPINDQRRIMRSPTKNKSHICVHSNTQASLNLKGLLSVDEKYVVLFCCTPCDTAKISRVKTKYLEKINLKYPKVPVKPKDKVAK